MVSALGSALVLVVSTLVMYAMAYKLALDSEHILNLNRVRESLVPMMNRIDEMADSMVAMVDRNFRCAADRMERSVRAASRCLSEEACIHSTESLAVWTFLQIETISLLLFVVFMVILFARENLLLHKVVTVKCN